MYLYSWFFMVYGFLGWCCEVAFAAVKNRKFVNRGFLNGPICPIYGFAVTLVIVCLNNFNQSGIALYFIAVLVTTAVEWVTGFILEKAFHNKWWDYSEMPFNLNGYVCLPFSMVWGGVCVFIVKVFQPFIKSFIMMIPNTLGVTVILVLWIVGVMDFIVTVTGILNLNKTLKQMNEITAQLRKVSDEIGENISDEVLKLLDKGNALQESVNKNKEAITQKFDRQREKLSELKQKYDELSKKYLLSNNRLLQAFPKMKSNRYKDEMEKLREKLKEKVKKNK